MLGDTVNVRAVRILLECILVSHKPECYPKETSYLTTSHDLYLLIVAIDRSLVHSQDRVKVTPRVDRSGIPHYRIPIGYFYKDLTYSCQEHAVG